MTPMAFLMSVSLHTILLILPVICSKSEVISNKTSTRDDFPASTRDEFPASTRDDFPASTRDEFPASTIDEVFKAKFLEAHNELRARHGSPPLMYVDYLDRQAESWADYMAQNDVYYHSNNGYGENLLKITSPVPFSLEGHIPVYDWYSESVNYDYSTGNSITGNIADIAHFTALVWRGSQKLGFGIAWPNRYQVYVVANYDPHGNTEGLYVENISRPN